MKNCGRCNVKKHRETKNGDKYTTLDISLDFGCLENMKITTSDQKYYLGRSGKELITSLSLRTIRRSKKKKKARHAITYIRRKDISKIIKEFEKLPYEVYVQKRSKHEPTEGYFI